VSDARRTFVPHSAKEQKLLANEQMDSRTLPMRTGKQPWPKERA
jgi:hypothetical protein